MINPFKNPAQHRQKHFVRCLASAFVGLAFCGFCLSIFHQYVTSDTAYSFDATTVTNAISQPWTKSDNTTKTDDISTRSDFLEQITISTDLTVKFNERNGALEQKFKMTPVKCKGLFAKSANITILMHDTGMIKWICGEKNSQELKVSRVMIHAFEKYGSRGLMLDIGANAGYYSLLAAKMGHNSVQFDLQPECQTILRNSVLANNFQKQIITVAAGVSNVEGAMEVPYVDCDGRFPQATPKKGAQTKTIPLYPLDHFISIDGDDIIMMKIDTEGNEMRVLSGAIRFFKEKKVKNAIVEVTPCCNFWKNAGIEASEVEQIFGEIVSYGYVMVSLWDYKIFRTTEEVVKYLHEPPFGQADMWLTLEDDIINLSTSVVPLKPDSSWYA
jgi:FkbM family methyltransferase